MLQVNVVAEEKEKNMFLYAASREHNEQCIQLFNVTNQTDDPCPQNHNHVRIRKDHCQCLL